MTRIASSSEHEDHRQKEEANHIEDIQRLVTEIEMLKVILYLVSSDG